MLDSIRKLIHRSDHQYLLQSKNHRKNKTDFTYLIPELIIHKIFSCLDSFQLGKCLRVNKQWQILANHETLWKALIPNIAFDGKQWAHYVGDIGIEPPFPKYIHKIIKSPCPFWKGKKVEDTHLLVLIPETIDGVPLNLLNLQKLLKASKESKVFQCHFHKFTWVKTVTKYCNQTPVQAHWVLMTKDAIKETENKNYEEQQVFITKFSKRLGVNYEIPTVVDAATCIFIHSMSSKEPSFNKNKDSLAFTRCQEEIDKSQLVISKSASDGLLININGLNNVGVAALRKLYHFRKINS